MKLYIKIENTDGDEIRRVITASDEVDAAVKVFRSLPVEFYGGKAIKPRIWYSELGFDSTEYEYLDTAEIIQKAGFVFL